MAERFWTQQQDIGPSARAGAAMAASEGAPTLLFGGYDSGVHLGDTWTWDGALWKQVDDVGPSPRSRSSIATTARGPILFGGQTDTGVVADTWLRAEGHWTQIADTGPAGRAWGGAAAVAPDRLLLFGGEGEGTMGDTWSLSGNSWTQVADTGPSPRSGHSMVFDGVRSRVVLFGGWDGSEVLSDTWEWDGATWLQVQDTGPGPLMGAAAVAAGGTTLLFGGRSAAGSAATSATGDTWSWDGALWTHVQDIGPGARWDAAASSGPNGTMVIFGGMSSTAELRADTWSIEVGSAASDPDPGEPGDPGPDPGEPGDPGPTDPGAGTPGPESVTSDDGLFTLSSWLIAQGSPLGVVTVDFSSPVAMEQQLDVTVEGGSYGIVPPNTVWSGESRTIALFALPPGALGTFRVRVQFLASSAEIEVHVIPSTGRLTDVYLTPPEQTPGGSFAVQAPMMPFGEPMTFQLVPLEPGLGAWEPIDVSDGETLAQGECIVPLDAPLGEYHLVPVLAGSAIWVDTERSFRVI